MRYQVLEMLLALLLAISMAACGSNSSTKNPVPPGTTPGGTGGSGGSGGSGTGGSGGSGGSGSNSSPQLTESMETYLTDTIAGQVVIAQNGSGTVSITGAPSNTTFSIAFCPFAATGGACNTVGTATSNASGAISATFAMGHGAYSGIFELLNGTTIAFISAFNVPASGSTLQSTLVRASTVGAGFPALTSVGFGVGFDPLASGSVTLNNASVHVVVAGALPNTGYGLTWCRNNPGSSCFAIGPLNTDASGNFTGDFDLSTTLGVGTGEAGVFYISGNKPPAIDFIQGFMVQ